MNKSDKKIKLTFVIAQAYPLFNHDKHSIIGGAEINLFNLAKWFSMRNEYDVTFLVGDFGQPDLEIYGEIKVRKMKYFEFDPNNKIYSGKKYSFLRFIYLVKLLFSIDSDVFINAIAGRMIANLVMIEKFIKGRIVIFRVSSDGEAGITKYCNTENSSIEKIFKFGIRNASRVVAQTYQQRSLLRINFELDSTMIKNGFFMSETESIDKKGILWVSRADYMKRPEIFLELAKRFPMEEFTMIIPGNNSIKDNVLKLATQLTNVKIIDSVPFDQIQKYFDKAKLFVNTSTFEGFPNSFIQAALGKTPILSFVVNPDEIIDKYDMGMVCGDDIKKAYEFIINLNDDIVAKLGSNAYKYAKENHDINSTASAYEELILQLMNEGDHFFE